MRTVAGCFAVFRSVHRTLPYALRTLARCVAGLNLTPLRQCDVGMHSIYLLRRMQFAIDSPALLIAGLSRSYHGGRRPSEFSSDLRRGRSTAATTRLGSAPSYLLASVYCVADVPSRRRLRSASTEALIVRSTPLVTVGDTAFRVVYLLNSAEYESTWNKLPMAVRAYASHYSCLLSPA